MNARDRKMLAQLKEAHAKLSGPVPIAISCTVPGRDFTPEEALRLANALHFDSMVLHYFPRLIQLIEGGTSKRKKLSAPRRALPLQPKRLPK